MLLEHAMSTPPRPLVSTIIPVYNRGSLLVEAVNSVLAQTYRPIEIVVVDDASTDDTPRVIESLAARHSELRAVRRANGGPGLARETGRLEAKGDLIQYLDSDDLLLPRKFELQVAALNEHPDRGVAYGIVRYRNAAGEEIVCDWKPANQIVDTLFPSLLIARWWETVSPLFRKSVTDAVGPWSALRLEEDWEYDARVAALGVKLAYVNEVVAEHRDHDEGRLSRGEALDPARLRDRARAHELIAKHAKRGSVLPEAPEMQTFARELFHVARQCGAAGLAEESCRLLAAAREISTARDLRAYAFVANAIGWTRAGRASMWIDRLR
jgi:glycosyltransferase involved in cell wall biosynthesis